MLVYLDREPLSYYFYTGVSMYDVKDHDSEVSWYD